MPAKGAFEVRQATPRGSRPITWPPGAHPAQHGIIGDDAALLSAISQAYAASRARYHIVIHGQTGTGKELVARYIHACSGLRGAFRSVNCALLPPDLAPSLLFGHTQGAFTGANRPTKGEFKLADHGTLFLDEIGELHPKVQAMLLRAISERTFTPVGAQTEESAQVCIVSASHADLWALVKQGRFREDLYHRMAQVHVELPALRDRPDDIVPIAHHLLAQLPRPDGAGPPTLSDAAARLLRGYPWEGNVRELHNVLRGSALSAQGEAIRPEHLPAAFRPPAPPNVAAPAVIARERILDQLGSAPGSAAQLAACADLSPWQVKAALRQLVAEGHIQRHGNGRSVWYSLPGVVEASGVAPGEAVDAALRLARVAPGVTSGALRAVLGGSLAAARRVLQALHRVGRLVVVNPGGRELLYRATGSAATGEGQAGEGATAPGDNRAPGARPKLGRPAEGEPTATKCAPAVPRAATPTPPRPQARPAAPSPQSGQHTVEEVSGVALDLVAASGRLTRAMLVAATGASLRTAGRALGRLVAEGRLRPGPGRGNQQDYVAVLATALPSERRPAGQDARAERARVQAMALEIATTEGKVTRAGLAERAGIDERAAGKILGAMVADGRLRRVGFGRGICYLAGPASERDARFEMRR